MRSTIKAGAVAIVAIAGLVLSGCSSSGSGSDDGGTAKSGGTLSYAIDAQPGTGGVDPIVASNAASAVYMNQIYETLLTRDDDGSIQPKLASSYTQSDDGSTYDFTLRKGVEFSDGTALTPEDVVFSFETWAAAKNSRSLFLKGMSSVKAVGDDTVEFTFSTPNGSFLNAVSSNSALYVFSKKWYEGTSEDDRQRSALGTGPFSLGEWKDNVSVTLDANEHYWAKGKPKVDAIEFQIVPDESARLALVQQGSVDMASFVDSNTASQAEDAGFTAGKASDTRKISIYLNPKSGPLADIRVRRALSLSLDRSQIVKLATEGSGAETLTVPVGDPLASKPDSSTPYYEQDIKEAKALLKEAGQENPTIELSYPSDYTTGDIPIFETMKQQAAKAGITLKLVGTPWSQISRIFTYGDDWSDMVAIWNRSNADYTGYFNQQLVDGSVFSRWDGNADADEAKELLTELTTETDQSKRATIAQELNDEVADKVLAIVPVAKAEAYQVWDSSKVGGYETDPYTWRSHLEDVYLK